jgi:hypothetical protein
MERQQVKVGRSKSKRPRPRKEPKVIRRIEEQLRKLRAQVGQLQEEMGQMRKELGARPQPQSGEAPDSSVILELHPDEYSRWIAEHLDALAKYPDCFVAIDPDKGREGVVLHSPDEALFSRRLREIRARDPGAYERLLVTHTSTYVGSGTAGG